MEMLFLKLLNMSINASILVLIALVFRLVFKKAPKWINCILWALVGIRLVIPFSLESKASLIPRGEPIPTTIIYQLNPQLNSPSQAVNEYVSNSLATSPYDSASKTGILLFALGCIWLIGLIIMILYSIISYAVLRNKLKTSTLYAKGIKQSDSIDSPFVLGVFNPTIYIPYSLKYSDIDYVIAHERAHIRRRDFLWKPLGFLILSVYWFNPVIWIAYIVLCRDIEAACDEKVISELDENSRKGYSLALLNCSVKHRFVTACPVAFGESGVKSRIRGIMNYKKPAFWIIVIAILASIVVGICFITNPKNEKEPTIDESNIANVGGAERNDRFVMRATVTEVGNGYMLVTPVDGSWELSSSDCFNISLVNMPASPEPVVGDVVEIEHNGVIQELYPASFSEIFSITVIRDESQIVDNLEIADIDNEYWEAYGVPFSDIRYDFGDFYVEPRGYFFDGYYLYYIYDVVNNPNADDIYIACNNDNAEIVYDISNQGDSRIVMRAIITFQDYHQKCELIIGANGSDITYTTTIEVKNEM